VRGRTRCRTTWAGDDPFGNLFEAAGAATSAFAYTGEWYGSYMKLLYLRARCYDPSIGVFLSRDPVEGEPPYLYVRGNPVNRVDPSGLTPVPWAIGTKYMYSCRCGWIDWSHASPRTSFIKRLGEAIATAETDSVLINGVLSIPGSQVVVHKPAVQQDHDLYAIALGIFISASNIFEEVIQGGSWHPGRAQSSFSNDDLVSNLIGFHRGVDHYEAGLEMDFDDEVSKKNYMEMCDVLGYEYYKLGRIDEFKKVQKAIYRDMRRKGEMPLPFRGRQTIWGMRPPDQWSGSIPLPSPSCLSVGCSGLDHLPDEIISITPAPPLYGWAWVSTSLDPRLPLPGREGTLPYDPSSIPDFRDPHYLNSRPLNWAPSGQ